jgi:hypothetical protein
MTSREFEQWFDHFAAAFPAVTDFIRKADPTGLETKKLWFGVLSKRDISDALTVTIGLFDGTLEKIPGDKGWTDWSSVPRHVSRLCAEMHPIEPEWKKDTYRDRSKVSVIDRDPQMASAYKRALEILDEGGTMDDVRTMLDEVFKTRQNYEPAFDEYNNT